MSVVYDRRLPELARLAERMAERNVQGLTWEAAKRDERAAVADPPAG